MDDKQPVRMLYDLMIYITNLAYKAPRDSVDRAVNSFVIANAFTKKKEFRYLFLSYTVYGFGLSLKQGFRNSVLNRVGKSVIFVLNTVRV